MSRQGKKSGPGRARPSARNPKAASRGSTVPAGSGIPESAAAIAGSAALIGDSAGGESRFAYRALRLALVGLAFAGFLISFYLTVTHYRNIVPPCYVTTGCETVTTSHYSSFAGIPVALAGAVFFGVMFYLSIALLTVPRTLVLVAYELLAYGGALAAMALFLLQALVLKAYCSYCLTTEVIAFLMWGAGFLLRSLRRSS